MKYLLILLLVVNPLLSWAQMEFGNWQERTPYGDLMEYNEGLRLYSTKTIEDIDSYYFYKGYTIGIYSADRRYNDVASYFITRSQDKLLLRFTDKKAWQAELDKRNLDPWWPRWHDDDWRWSSLIVLILIFCFILWFPIALFIGIILYKARNDLPKRFFRGLFIGMASVVLYIFIHDTFPQSFI